jgi:hypothetical protein
MLLTVMICFAILQTVMYIVIKNISTFFEFYLFIQKVRHIFVLSKQ